MSNKKNVVLFVDDEQDILSAIRRATVNEKFTAVFANSGKAALEIMERNEVSVLVTDMRMPEMDGLALLRIVRELYPKTVRIVLSGYTNLSQVLATVNRGDIFQFIAKPWQMREELVAAVSQGIERFNLEAERDELVNRLEKKNQAYLNIFGKMEEKFAHEKKVLANIMRVHRWTFSYWKRHHQADKLEDIDFIEVIQLMYLNLLPAVPEEKSSDKMIKDITDACSGRVQIIITQGGEWTFAGYHVFLLTACKILMSIIAAEPGKVISLTLETGDFGARVSEITLGIAKESLFLSTVDQNKLIIGCSLLNEMCEIFDTSIRMEMLNGKVDSLRLICRSK